jgi:N-acetylmuramoyl-L-alanine amidase
VILHHIYTKTLQGTFDILNDEVLQVSAHYVVDESREIFRMVEEDKRAWHAGVSWWAGIVDLNSYSIGIEVRNRFRLEELQPFSEQHIATLQWLLADICKRWQIPPKHILAHSDIATGRKVDPGCLFPWKTLAGSGGAIWPDNAECKDGDDITHIADARRIFVEYAELFGYKPCDPNDMESFFVLLKAFQIHYRPESYRQGLEGGLTEGALAVMQELAIHWPAEKL